MGRQTHPDRESSHGSKRERLDRFGARALAGSFFLPLLHLAILLASAGRLDWIRAWNYAGMMLVLYALLDVVVLVKNPAVYNARGRPHEGSEPFDRPLLRIHVLLVVVMLIVSGLDAGRFGWTPLPLDAAWMGAGMILVGFALSSSALAVNPHFEPTVRIQTDRNHRVIRTGPYRFIRHPGYASLLLAVPGFTLFLGSGLGLVVAALDVVLMARRTVLEERALAEKLPGYKAYQHEVGYRWVPGIW